MAEPEWLGIGELHAECPTLAVADDRGGVRCDAVDHRRGVTQIGVPAVQGGVIAVTVTALIPRHDPPPCTRKARCEAREGAGEVGAAVHEEQRWGTGIPPFVDGEANPVGIDMVAPGGLLGPREVDRHLL